MSMTFRETKSRSATATSTIACRLEGDDYRRRLASIGELARAALLDHRRDDCSLCLAYAPEAATRVRRMVEEERVCCPFLVIELEETAEGVFVKITPPPLDPAMLDVLFDHFSAGIPARPSTALPEREDKPAIEVRRDRPTSEA
jgi:hypothetical protein